MKQQLSYPECKKLLDKTKIKAEELYLVLLIGEPMPRIYSYGSMSEIMKDIEDLILEKCYDEDEIYVCKGVGFKTYKYTKITVEIGD
jgi:hypothetical protein